MSGVPGQIPAGPSVPVPPSGTPPVPPGQPAPLVHKTPWTAYIKPAVWTLIALYVIIFVFINRDSVTINFMFAKAIVPMIFVLIGMAFIGAGLCAGVIVFSRRRELKKAKAAQASGQPPAAKKGS